MKGKTRKTMKKLMGKAMAGVMAFALTMGMTGIVPVRAADTRLTVPKFDAAPVIDGKVSEAEWGTKAFTVKDGEENIATLDEGGVFPADFSADIYLGYDSTHIYIAAVANYEIHKNEALLPQDLWQGDCMQIQISPLLDTDRNELGFTLNNLTNKQQAVAWASTGNFTMEGGEGADYLVSRDGTTTTYEIALGVDQFTTKLTELADGMTLPFSLSFHMSGGGFLEYAAGIVQAKDITKAALIGLGAAPDESAAPPVMIDPNAVNVNNNLLDTRTEIGNRSVPGTIEAEDYDELYGTEIHAGDCPDGGQNLGWTADGDYMVYKNVNFTAVPDGVNFRVSGTGTPTVQIRLDAVDGSKIAEKQIEASGNWDTYITVPAELINTDGIQGTHDVYLLINGGMNINWFEFTGTAAAEEPTAEPTLEPTLEPTANPTAVPTEAPSEPVTAPAQESGSNTMVIVVIVVVAVAAIGAVAFVVVKNKKNGGKR
ncbi:hypothetical protein HNQ56_001493 [Anaerotaenia torta]|uniref:carbohydrate-binding protein n=1 Tax=Anaerotaenia torta TaxID=433293 RepID=UPI003D20CBE8